MIPVMIEMFGDRELNPRIQNDPRFSESQRQALRKIGEADPEAMLKGLDDQMRPVVRVKLDGPGRETVYSLLRNGAPAKCRKLEESWSR